MTENNQNPVNVDSNRLEKKHIFTYSISNFKMSDKIRFYYALKGRDGKSGIIERTKAIQLGKAVILADDKFKQEFEEFFKVWKIESNILTIYVEINPPSQ